MHIALTPEQERLREELREYFAALVTPEVKAGLASATGEFGEAGVYKKVIQQLGTDGWLGIGWPTEYGGQARSMVDQLIFTDVAADFGVPIPYLTLNTVGPTVLMVRNGTGAPTRLASSMKISWSTIERAWPPYSSGHPMPSQPSEPIWRTRPL